jgi:hypothetical protein
VHCVIHPISYHGFLPPSMVEGTDEDVTSMTNMTDFRNVPNNNIF